MKKTQHRKERGQALILIVFAIIGLIGMTGLAVDGGNAYAERRRAQNAADTSAIDAALAKVRGGNLYTEGLARAASNDYTDADHTSGSSDPDVNVEIYSPPIDGPYAANTEYIQVKITATINTYFGGVLGIDTITNEVEAVARAKPSQTFPIAFGNAIVSLAPHECKAVKYQGNADTLLVGGGIYVNSDCNDSAFFNNSGSALLTAPCLQAVGGITYKPGSINVPGGCITSGVSTLPEIVYPDPTCSGNSSVSGNVMSPGSYSGNKFPPAGVDTLEPGIYCVNANNGFVLNGGDSLYGDNVVIVMNGGDVSWNGGAEVNLSAPDSGPYPGLLIFMPESNSGTISINGNSDSAFTGTVLAPSAGVTVNGTGAADGFHCQIIGYTVDISGTSNMHIYYDDEDNYDAPIPPQVELVQ